MLGIRHLRGFAASRIDEPMRPPRSRSALIRPDISGAFMMLPGGQRVGTEHPKEIGAGDIGHGDEQLVTDICWAAPLRGS